jgi:hypothetical protein
MIEPKAVKTEINKLAGFRKTWVLEYTRSGGFPQPLGVCARRPRLR